MCRTAQHTVNSTVTARFVYCLTSDGKKKPFVRVKHGAVRSPAKRYELYFIYRGMILRSLQTAEMAFSACTANKSVLYIIILCSAERRIFYYNTLLNVRVS